VHWQHPQHRSVHEELDYLDECVDLASRSKAELSNHKPQTPLQLDPSIRSELRDAIRQHHYQAVASVLAQNTGYIDAMTLNTAIKFYDSAIFSPLIGHGAMINGDVNELLAAPLYVAAKRGNIAAVIALLQYSANVEGNNAYPATPLTGAVSGGHVTVVQYLVENGANINGNRWKSPLSCAFKHEHTDVAFYLLNHGASIRPDDLREYFSYFGKNGHLDIGKYLVNNGHGADVNRGGYFDEPLLSSAAQNGHIDVVRYLISQGADVNGNGYHDSPLTGAANNGHIDVVRYLVSQGANVNGNAYYDSPPTDATEDADIDDFMWPLPNYNPEKVCYLPVRKAARNGHINIVKYLLSKGKKVNGGRCPYLPPSGAARDGHIDFIEYLVSHGADANGSNIRYCPIVAAIQTRERHKVGRQLLLRLSKSHQRLMDGSGHPSASVNLRLFGEQLGTCKSIWRNGTRVIRNLMIGNLPNKLPDVISCLQVADVMRSAVPNTALVCSKQE
jgi:ankyrin repeat protein